jgi:hypothetical protein
VSYTYDTLLADVVANMEEDSSEFLDALPSIISRAQAYLQRRTDPINIITFSEIPVSAGVRTANLPANLLVLRSIQVSTSAGNINLIQQTNEYLTAFWPDYVSVAPPKYYAAKDNTQIFVAPTPDTNTNASIEYIPRVATLTSAAPTNWFSENADAAFFAASMMYANAWTKNANAVAVWKTQADEELAAINNEARRTRRSDTSDRNGGTPENNIAPGQA